MILKNALFSLCGLKKKIDTPVSSAGFLWELHTSRTTAVQHLEFIHLARQILNSHRIKCLRERKLILGGPLWVHVTHIVLFECYNVKYVMLRKAGE